MNKLLKTSFLVVVFVALLSFLLKIMLEIPIYYTLRAITGTILVFFLPGFILTESYYKELNNKFKWLLYIVLSILISGVLGLLACYLKIDNVLLLVLLLIFFCFFIFFLNIKNIFSLIPREVHKHENDIDKKRIFFISLFMTGVLLVFYSWFISFPTNITYFDDYTFLHFSILYWLGLVMSIASITIICFISKSQKEKFIFSFFFLILFFSSFFFYDNFAGSDSHYFRSLSDTFNNHKQVDTYSQGYFQWPSFFSLVKIFSTLTKFDINLVSIFLFLIFAFIISSSLYLFYEKYNKKNAFLGVFLYIILSYYFLNLQFAPQTLALGLLLTLVLLTEKINFAKAEPKYKCIVILLFFFLVAMHAFISLFFVLYLFVYTLIIFIKRKNNQLDMANLSILSLVVYIGYWFLFGVKTLGSTVNRVFKSLFYGLANLNSQSYKHITKLAVERPNEIAYLQSQQIVSKNSATLFQKSSYHLYVDSIAQLISRIVVIPLLVLAVFGYIKELISKKIDSSNLSLLIAGLIYLIVGFFFDILGLRAVQIILIPLVAGIFFYLRKFFSIFKIVFLIFIILSVALIVHSNFDYVNYHAPHEKRAANYVVDLIKEKQEVKGRLPVLSVFSTDNTADYIYGKADLRNKYYFLWYDFKKRDNYDFVIWNNEVMKQLRKNLKISNSAVYQYKNFFDINYNRVYDDGTSYVYI